MKFLKNNALTLFMLILVMGLIVLLANKDKLYQYISGQMQAQAESVGGMNEKTIKTKYNYLYNGQDYDFTFLEFGSTGCAQCKRMEPVLEEMKGNETLKMKVEFIHIMKPENQELMKYYGVSVVPMQVLLDGKGEEFFRHYGFISAAELEQICLKHQPDERKMKDNTNDSKSIR